MLGVVDTGDGRAWNDFRLMLKKKWSDAMAMWNFSSKNTLQAERVNKTKDHIAM